MYLRFDVYWQSHVDDIKKEIDAWAQRYGVRYTYKTIKNHFRVGFDNDKHFSLFLLTFNPDLEKRPYLKHELVNVQNEKY